MKKILFLLALIVSFTSCKKEAIEPAPAPAPTQTVSNNGNGNGNGGTTPTSFFVGFNVDNNENLIDYPDVTINGVSLTYVAENFNTLNVNDNVIDRAFEYSIPSGLISCNDSIDYTIVFNDADIVGVTIFGIQVFSSMDGTNVQCINQPWVGWQQWEEPTSVPFTVYRTPSITFICN
jgi:hypothetical protein